MRCRRTNPRGSSGTAWAATSCCTTRASGRSVSPRWSRSRASASRRRRRRRLRPSSLRVVDGDLRVARVRFGNADRRARVGHTGDGAVVPCLRRVDRGLRDETLGDQILRAPQRLRRVAFLGLGLLEARTGSADLSRRAVGLRDDVGATAHPAGDPGRRCRAGRAPGHSRARRATGAGGQPVGLSAAVSPGLRRRLRQRSFRHAAGSCALRGRRQLPHRLAGRFRTVQEEVTWPRAGAGR